MEGPLFFQGPLCSLPDKTQRHRALEALYRPDKVEG